MAEDIVLNLKSTKNIKELNRQTSLADKLKLCVGVRDNVFGKIGNLNLAFIGPDLAIVTMKKIDWQCKRCGNCCITEEVEPTEKEVNTIRESTGRNDFWIHDDKSKTGYKIKHVNGKCIFLNDQRRCSIYNTRPILCQTYPFVVDETEIDGRNVVLIMPKITCTNDDKIICNGFQWGKMNKKVALKAAKKFLSVWEQNKG